MSRERSDRVSVIKRIDKMDDSKILKELKKANQALEFSIAAPKEEEEEEMLKDFRVDTTFDHDDYMNHVNLDCLNDSDDPNTTPFDSIAKKMVNVTPDGGVKKKILRAGCGPTLLEKALVYVHYNCYLELEEVPFDSSYLRSSNPESVQFGCSHTYPGFEIAVASMIQGEKAQFLIEPKYAFREMGIPPRIPPNASVLLEVDLIKVVNGGGDGVNSINETSDYEDYKRFPFAFKKAKSLHILGNDHFQNKSYRDAINCYKKAAGLLTSCSLANDEEENNQKHLLMKVFTNLCICYNRINIPQKACIAARDALQIDHILANNSAKLHFGWGKALINLSDFKRASEHLKKALSLEPNNKEITKALLDLEKRREEYYRHEKITYKKALGLDKSSFSNQTNKESSNTESSSNICLNKELEEFAKSSRSRLELPAGITKEEREVIRRTAESLGLIFNELKRPTGDVIALTK